MNPDSIFRACILKAARLSCSGLILSILLLLAVVIRPAGADSPGFVPDEILVGYRSGTNLPALSQPPPRGKRIGRVKALNVERIKLPPGMTIAQAMAQYQQMPGVQFVERNHIYHVASTPNDPFYTTNQNAPWRVQADLAWDIWRPQAQVIIAIIDSGVDNGHPDLTNKILRDANGIVGWNAQLIDPATGLAGVRDNALDDFGHGTHVAGIAAAQSNNGIGIAGIAGWDGNSAHTDVSVKVMPVKVLLNGGGTDADVAGGIVWAADHGAKVLSMSLGETEYSNTLDSACQYAWSKNCVIVAAAGNNGSSDFFYPAANNHVIAVAATDLGDELASFSNWGTWVQVTAPGVNVYSTLPTYATSSGFGTNYGALSGTSMSTPHVAGEAALLLAQNPALTNAQVVNLIESYVDDYTAAGGRVISATGGRINVLKALQAATNPQPPNTPNGFVATLQNTNILLSWRQTAGAVSYNLYRGLTPGGEGATPYKTGLTGLAFTDVGVIGTSYYYQLAAVGNNGESLRTAELKVTPDGSLYRINCGGEAIGLYAADNYFTSGAPYYSGGTVNISGVASPAPAVAYQCVRADPSQFGYSFPGLSPGNSYKIRLHFMEGFWTTPGQRPFDVSINGSQVLAGFDPYTAAGAGFTAVVREFTIAADNAGKMNITFSSPQNLFPIVSAIEILPGTPQAPPVPTGLVASPGNNQITLTWNISAGATTYNLYRSTTSGGEGTTPYKTGLTSAAFTDTGLTNGTTYFYKVSAVNSVGESSQSSEASATPAANSAVYQINAGGPAVGTFSADNYFTGGAAYTLSNVIDTSGVTNPAPASAYQTQRADFSNFSYSLPGLTANGSYKVRLHFAEVYWTTAGQRPFDVFINGVQVLSNFDILTAAGAANKAVVKEFNVSADSSGKIGIVFSSPSSKAPCVCAIEVLSTAPVAPSTPTGLTATAGNTQVALAWNAVSGATTYNLYRATSAGGEGTTPYKTGLTSASYTDTGLTNGTTYFYKVSAVNSVGESSQSSEASATPAANSAVYQINAGGPAVGTFSADNYFTGGAAYTLSNVIDTSGVTNPAPASAYQTQRADFSNFSYSLPGLTANGSYKVRLHFAEVYWTTAGQRPFDVFINGVQVLSNFDIFTAAGAANKAVVKEFNVSADSSGKIGIVFSSPSSKAPCVCAIEVLSTAPVAPSTPTGLTATAGNAQVALTWATVSGAASYNLYRSTTSGGEGTAPYKTGLTSAAYTDTGLTNGTTYFYKVSAVNSVGESSQSSEASATPSASAAPLYQINAGGGAIGTFSVDNFFTGGAAYSTSPAIDTSGVTNPAPASAYQTQRADFSSFSYSLPGLTANGSYKVRLHFAEVYWTVAGQRPFDVTINGVQVLSNFDIFTAAGAANKAVVREFNVTADATGKLNILFSSPNNKAPCVCAIEVLNGP